MLTLHHIYIYLNLIIPQINLDLAKNNFVFQASCIWNELIPKILNKCFPNKTGIMLPGSVKDSDLSIPIALAKKKLRDVLLYTQKADPQKYLLGWSETGIGILRIFSHQTLLYR